MKKNNFYLKIFLIFLIFVLFYGLLNVSSALAEGTGPEGEPGSKTTGSDLQEISGPLDALNFIQGNVGEELMPSSNLLLWIVRILNYILTFIGVIFLLMIIYGGFMWMTAAGNEERIKKGKGILQTAVVGLVIIILARVIYIFIMQRIQEA